MNLFMRFRVLYVLVNGYGIALAVTMIVSILGADALETLLTFWLGGAVATIAIPVLERMQLPAIHTRRSE